MTDENTNTEEVKEEAKVEEAPASSDASQDGPKEEKKASKEVSKGLSDIIEKIEKLSVLELADLVHALEDKFGVTAAAPMAVAGATSGAPTGDATPAEEQTSFDVILTSAGANKIGAIKAVREIVPTLGLKEAKDLVEAAPKTVKDNATKEEAAKIKATLEAAGAKVEIK